VRALEAREQAVTGETPRTPQEHHEVYFDVMRDLMATTPSAIDHIQDVNNCILSGDYYRALKAARKLTEHESQLLKHARTIQQPKLAGAA